MVTNRFVQPGIVVLIFSIALAACGTQSTPATLTTAAEAPVTAAPASGDSDASVDTPVTETEAATTEASTTSEINFSADVLPILESRCLQCHGGQRTEGNFAVSSYSTLMAGGESGAVIAPGDAENSHLYDLVASGKMPKRGAKLTPVQLNVIAAWINAGALDN
ncbi:MAG: hypothetical protein JXA13_04765 [Anaerolineales bacterium]|nr:hypothetical protein [Anaerolineales bacterium]